MEEITCNIPKKINEFLKKNTVKFKLINHKTVFTAHDKAATLKVKPSIIAKVLVLRADKELIAAVIAGDKNLDIEKLKKAARAKKIDFIKEATIKEKFKNINPGVIPPFGDLWQIKVFADKSLVEQSKIILPSGRYETSLELTPAAFLKANPKIIIDNFSKPRNKIKKTIKPLKKQK